MDTDFTNCYEDGSRASAYATLEFKNTYHLAFRDLPEILRQHVKGTRALDFGCGTGRSARLLKSLGFHTIGVDISEDMLRIARGLDPQGDYRHVPDDNFADFAEVTFDLILSAFTFDNIPAMSKPRILGDLRKLLDVEGTLVSVVSAPEIYTHEWASFSTKDFPENAAARSGDVVRIVVTDHQDRRPVEDILCTDESYQHLYRNAGLRVERVIRPLARRDEPYPWLNETSIAPWTIYVLKRTR